MTRPTNTVAHDHQNADEPLLSAEVLALIDHIAEILAEEFAAAMQLKKETGDASSGLR